MEELQNFRLQRLIMRAIADVHTRHRHRLASLLLRSCFDHKLGETDVVLRRDRPRTVRGRGEQNLQFQTDRALNKQYLELMERLGTNDFFEN